MKRLTPVIFPIAFIFLFGISSCVSKKKYTEVQKKSASRDSSAMVERIRLTAMNDSLRYLIATKDSIIDTLSLKLNDVAAKKEKERARNSGLSTKKSTLSKEQEYDKKSLFIYNFTKYIEWPIEYNGTEFVIGVAGDDQALKQLQAFMSQKRISGKKVIVEMYKKGPKYNLVYITSSAASHFVDIKNAVKKNKTLLVTDESAFGTHITFMLDQDKVRYIVDKITIEKTGLKVGQELMRYSG